ncbi:uncharacterized protein BP01DRAFT_385070 [Aspergillus saccharolyticus JOP 1030-1]|uniref:Glycosyl hydrolases family 2 sugar binding domain-containing protein n=1 Tax=Aspergillus saccharolyticus JOP 1030-1 TaxID=1450539 RepID=A0A318Z6U0_9EURO|nr:hypothetical protein BP01DRAFT_385070 [Aspergillus saccharolyticus JOP 1030-1]PYH42866.1 hypothetical protein BP01DRAFT_385070 [Aspergillus saccharolyticus JOP 1030-1]
MRTPPQTLTNWTLTVESWTPAANIYSLTAAPTRTNTTYALGTMSTLLPWSQLHPSLQNVSGIGFYRTTVTLAHSPSPSPSPSSGVILDLGRISHVARIRVNGHPTHPVDLHSAKLDITQGVMDGENTIDVMVASPLGNAVRRY